MMYNKWQILVSFCFVTLVSSCVRNQFDLQRYEEIVQELSPVDDVDENHDWQLSTTKMLTVDLSGLEDIERIQVLTDNPTVTSQPTILGEAYVENKSNVLMSVSYPNLQESFYAAAIDNAHHLVQIVNPYATLVRTVRRSLYRALKRGVRLQIMVSTDCDVSVTPTIVAQEMRKLMKRGAEVYYFDGGFHHSKYMTVDGEFCTIGTANLDGRSLCCDYEVNSFIFDPAVTHELEDVFRHDREERCTLLTPQLWKDKFSLCTRFSGRFFSLIKNAL